MTACCTQVLAIIIERRDGSIADATRAASSELSTTTIIMDTTFLTAGFMVPLAPSATEERSILGECVGALDHHWGRRKLARDR
jgi:hypothetical protein